MSPVAAYKSPNRKSGEPLSVDLNGPTEKPAGDELVVTSCQHYCLQMMVKVGLSAVTLGIYLYLAMAASSLYLIGLVGAVGVAMVVQGYMRRWSLQQLQQEYILKPTTGTTSSGICSTRGTIVNRRSDGFDPAVAAAVCHPVNMCGQDESYTIPEERTPPRPAKQSSIRDVEKGQEAMADGTVQQTQRELPYDDGNGVSYSVDYSIVVQYQAHVPKGYVRSDGHVMETAGVDCVVVKEFKHVHPDLYFDTMPTTATTAAASSANDDGTLEIVYRPEEPKSGFVRAMLQEYAPKHQNGRIVIGSFVFCLCVAMMASKHRPWTVSDLLAAGVNLILFVTVACVVHKRSMSKHESMRRGDEAAHITAWMARSTKPLLKDEQTPTRANNNKGNHGTYQSPKVGNDDSKSSPTSSPKELFPV